MNFAAADLTTVHAPSLLQGSHLSFRRGDDLLRERCEQRFKPLVSIHRQHPLVFPVAFEHCVRPRTIFEQGLNGHGKVGDYIPLLAIARRESTARGLRSRN